MTLSTQITLQVQLERTQVVSSNKEERKRRNKLPVPKNGFGILELILVTIQIESEQLTLMQVPWLRIHARSSPFRRGVCSVAGSTLYSLLLYIHRGI